MKALNETEKLKSSSEAYKKDQLLQQIADKEEELQRAQDQAASLVSDNDGAPLTMSASWAGSSSFKGTCKLSIKACASSNETHQ